MKIGNILGCHQRADRSFFIKGYQFPICARCTGVIAGYLIFIITVWFFTFPWYINILFMLVMLADWLIQYLKWKPSTNPRRFITGVLCGYGIWAICKIIIIYIYDLLK